MRKILVALLVLGLLASPAGAAKKPKKPKPFTASGSFVAPSPAGLPVTETEFFLATCPDMPASQGVDAYVVEIPIDFSTGAAMVEVEGGGVPGAGSFAFSFWSFGCGDTLGVEQGPTTFVPPGTAYIIVFNEAAAAVDFELTVSIP